MFGSVQDIHALARKLEYHFLANAERHAQFALLSDYLDADLETNPGDAALLHEAIAAIDALERTYPPPFGMPRRFLLLHRNREWSETEQRWIGWERKRGKLMQLIGWLAERGPLPFVDLGDRSRAVDGTPYVVTLDSDTELPPGVLHALVAVAAHPANRPRVDHARRRVASGFGILQPRIVTPLPSRAVTVFHWLFAGQSGIDPYSAVISEVYQDLFDEGTFTGKGLLDVHALHAVLANRLPEGAGAQPRPDGRIHHPMRRRQRRHVDRRRTDARRRRCRAGTSLDARRLAIATGAVAARSTTDYARSTAGNWWTTCAAPSSRRSRWPCSRAVSLVDRCPRSLR